MKTSKVYIGLNKKNEIILLFKKDDSTYIDLFSIKNEIYPIDYINLSSLKKIGETIDIVKFMSPANVKRKFSKNKNIIIEKIK